MSTKRMYLAKGLNVSCRTIENTSYILFEDRGELIQLNEMGSLIWDSINGTRTLEQVVNLCKVSYEDEATMIEDYVIEFVSNLFQLDAVVSSENEFTGVMVYGN